MQIQKINNINYNQKTQYNPQFKKAYGVVHWVGETSGTFSPVASFDLAKKLQTKLVNILNDSARLKHGTLNKTVTEYLASKDPDYGKKFAKVRTFNDNYGGENKLSGKYFPFSYLFSGGDAFKFDEKYGKPLGVAKAQAPKRNGVPDSAELQIARSNYYIGGWQYVNDKNKKLYIDGVEQELHTKFEVVRNKKGEIKDYNLVGIELAPIKGETNPFIKAGYTNAREK
jgi:hypothetical protein